jgi:signal transduction histidine kinase/DNA-binding response OmpR family regulator
MLDIPAKANVLIVDDRPDKHIVFRAILEDLGQTLVTATSGEEALKHVLHRDFAVILLDVNMPGLDGLETAALIRSRAKSRHVPIIFITADYTDEVRTTKGYSLGAVDYMISPVVPEILRSKVKVFVDLYLLAQQAKRQAEEHITLAEERAARAAAERATHRSAFLSRASVALSGSLDFEATSRELLSLVVPFLADVCALTLPPEEDLEEGTHLAWAGPPPERRLSTQAAAKIESAWLRQTVDRVMASGSGETYFDSGSLAASGRPAGGSSGERLEMPGGTGIDALVVLPLLARGRTLGVLSLGMGPSGRGFDPDLLSVATDLSSRAAVALDNALLYRKLHEQDRRKNEFLAMLSHELRNPLAPITNAVHVLQKEDVGSEKLSWAKDVISRQLKQLVRLVDDLLDVSRITQGKIDLKIEAIDVAEVVSAAVETSRPVVDAHEHTLTLLLPRKSARVNADFARLAQILSNLINNAAKYTKQRGQISLTATKEGAEVIFRVRDSGMGIPKESLSSIFDLFTQVDHTLDRSQGGLGVGLTLVKRLVEMQGGTVSAFSGGKDQGSEFTVRLPAAASESLAVAAAGAGKGGAKSVTSDFCVLIVDDNRDVADSTAVLLRMAGYDVQLAYDGKDALESVQRLQPDAVLLDIGLPGMDGYQVAERIRCDSANRRPLIVAVSGYSQEEHRARSRNAGFDHHIVKPIDPAQLAELLASMRSSRQSASPENVVRFPAQKSSK